MSTLKSNLMPGDSTGKFITTGAGKNRNTVHISVDNFAVATTDAEAADQIHLLHIPTNAILNRVSILNDTLDSVADLVVDLGFYDKDGVVVDKDVLVDGSTEFQTANTSWVDLYRPTVLTVGDRVWEVAGVASVDPVEDYILALTVDVVAATPVAGDIAVEIEWMSIN